MNERILMKLAEAEKKRRLTERQKAMLGGAIGAASGVSLGGVLFNSPATRKQVAAAAAAGALYGLGETALRERLRRQAANANLQKTAAYGDTIKNLASRVEGGAQNAFQKLRNTPYGDTIKNLAGRVESGAQNAFQKLRNTSGAIKPLQQQNLARSVSQFAQRNAKALTTGAIGLGAAGAVAGGIAAARAIKNKRQGQEKTASYYAARELLGLQKEANLILAGPPAKDQILKIIRDLAKKK